MSESALTLSDRTADPTPATGGDGEGGKAPAATPTSPPAPTKAAEPAANDNAWHKQFATGLDETVAKDWINWSSRYKEPAEFAKSYVEFRKTAVVLPKDDKPESWDPVWNRLGRPEAPDKYQWNHLKDAPALDEAEQGVRNGFAPVAYRAGLNQKQIDAVVPLHDQQRKITTDAMTAKAETAHKEGIKALKGEWKDDFDKNVQFHGQAFKAYAGDMAKDLAGLRLADGTFVFDHPGIVKMMSKIGAERAEDGRQAEQINASTRDSAMTEIAKIENEATSKGLYPSHPMWPSEQLKALYGRAYGTKPIQVGAITRR
jgi:hypothetical protein